MKLALVLLAAPASADWINAFVKGGPAVPKKEDHGILMDHIKHWGEWGEKKYCGDNYFAQDIALRSEKPQKDGDDTATNAIRINCSNGKKLQEAGLYGTWGEQTGCEPGFKMSAIMIEMEPAGSEVVEKCKQILRHKCDDDDTKIISYDPVGFDDTAINGIRVKCSRFPGETRTGANKDKQWYELAPEAQTSWGRWMNWVDCPTGEFIAGIQQKIEP